MKRKFYLLVTCVLSSASSSIIVQAMQETQEQMLKKAEQEMEKLLPQTPVTEVATESLTSPAARNKFYYHLIRERIHEKDVTGALDALQTGVKQGFDVNTQVSGRTLLHEAVLAGNADIIIALTQAGANPEPILAMQQQKQAQTITTCIRSLKAGALLELTKAIQTGKVKKDVAISLLPEELSILLESLLTTNLTISELEQAARSQTHTLLNRLSASIQARVHRMVCYLLSTPITTLDDLLAEALHYNDTDTVKMLLDARVNPNRYLDHLGNLYTPLMKAVEQKNTSLVTLLLNAGADPNKELGPGSRYITINRFGYYSPLMIALRLNEMPIVSSLLDAGARVNAPDSKNRTPLMVAARYGTPQIVELLLSRGADITRVDNEGKTALDYARNSDIRQLLSA